MALVALLLAAPTSAHPHHACTPQAQFRSFAERVWDPARWRRGDPPVATIRAYGHRLSCAVSHRGDMKATWRRLRRRYYEHRRRMLWREKYKPFVYPDGSRWAAPYPVVWCESGPGGDYGIGPSGAYGEIPPLPQDQSPKVQDEIAYQLLHTVGVYQAWRRWEIAQGCPYF